MAFTPNRPGLADFGQNATSLLYEGFAGETVAVFEKTIKLMDTVDTIDVQPGVVSISFPVFNTGNGKSFSPGDDIFADGYISPMKQGKIVLSADKKYVSAAAVDDLDAMVSAYPARQVYSQQLGQHVAAIFDQQIIRCVWNAVDKAAIFTGYANTNPSVGTGYANTGNTNSTSANALYLAIQGCKTALDNNNIPDTERYLVITPAEIGRASCRERV